MRHLLWGGVAALVGAWIVACVGSDPDTAGPTADPSVPVGQWKGACTADGKCLQGLECTQGVCLYPGDGAPPVDGSTSSSGGSSSGGSSSGGSSGGGNVACAAPADSMDTKIACGGAGACASECCVGASGPSACEATCPTVDPRRSFKCDSKYQCVNSGEECCLGLKPSTVIAKNVCPSPVAFVDVIVAECIAGGCDTAAGSGQFKMCRSDSECASPATCRQIEISTSSTKLPFSICME